MQTNVAMNATEHSDRPMIYCN